MLTIGNEYRSKSIFEAAFLVYKDFQILRKEPSEDKKFYLIFEDSNELREAVKNFYQIKSKERILFDSFRMVKDYLYDR